MKRCQNYRVEIRRGGATYSLATKACKSQVEASLIMISNIFLRMALTCEVKAYVVFLIWLGRRAVKPMANNLNKYPSEVLTSTLASMRVCHLRMRDLCLSEVITIPWKLVKQSLPTTSSMRSLNLHHAWVSFLFKSPRDASTTRPLRLSEAMSRYIS